MPIFKLTAKKSIRYKINRALLLFYPACVIAGLLYYFLFNKSHLVTTIILPAILFFLLFLGNKIKPKHPFILLNEEKVSWLLDAGTSMQTIIWKDIAWIKREENEFIFYTQSSFSKHLPLHYVATEEEKNVIINYIVTHALKTNTKLVYKNTITA